MSENNKIIIYQDDNEIIRVCSTFCPMKICSWEQQLAEIYCTTQQNISQHVDNIYKDGDYSQKQPTRNFASLRQKAIVRWDDVTFPLQSRHGYRLGLSCNLRLQSDHVYPKGFLSGLKAGAPLQLPQRIRIFVVVNVLHQQVSDIYATTTDYDPRDDDKDVLPPCKIMPFTKNTAAEVIYNRVDNESRLWVWRTSKATMWLRMMWRLPRTICQK